MSRFKKNTTELLNKIDQQIQGFKPVNTINIEQRIEATNAAIDSQISRSSILSSVVWTDWVIINQWADYFANVFAYESDRLEMDIFINRVIRQGFIFGYCYVWNNNGTPEIVSVVKKNKDTCDIYIINSDEDYLEKGGSYYDSKKANKFNVPIDQLIRYQFNSLGWSSFVVLKPIIKLNKLVMKSLYNDTLMNTSRLIHQVEFDMTDVKTSQQFVNFESPVIHKSGDGTDTFRALQLATNTQSLIDVIEYAKNYYYEILGRRTNSDFKRTHSLDSEIDAAQQTFEILERDRYRWLKHFLRQFSKMFNLEIMLENSIGEYKNVNERDILKDNEVKNGYNNTKDIK